MIKNMPDKPLNEQINQKIEKFKKHFKKNQQQCIVSLSLIGLLTFGLLCTILFQKDRHKYKWQHFDWNECDAPTTKFDSSSVSLAAIPFTGQKLDTIFPKANRINAVLYTKRKYLVDGYGYQCSKIRILTKYLLNYKSEIKVEVIELTRDDCFQMHTTQLCDNKPMICNHNNHTCYSDFQEEIKGWFSTLYIRHTCTMYVKRLKKEYLDDVILYNGTNMCKVFNYECRTNDSIIAWDKSVIQTCLYMPNDTRTYESVYLNKRLYLYSIGNTPREIHEITSKITLCDKELHKSKYGHLFEFLNLNLIENNRRLAPLKKQSKFLANVLVKKPHTIDGYGVECKKFRYINLDFFNFFTIENASIELFELSKANCLEMINSRVCDNSQMSCDANNNCKLEYETIKNDWWFIRSRAKISCQLNTVHILARTQADFVLTDLKIEKPCRFSEYKCRTKESLVVWNQDIIDNCPFEFLETRLFLRTIIQNRIFLHSIDDNHESNSKSQNIYEIIDMIKQCSQKWYVSANGYYFSFTNDDIVEYENKTDIIDVSRKATHLISKLNVHNEFQQALCKHHLSIMDRFTRGHTTELLKYDFDNFYLLYSYQLQFYISNSIFIEKINLFIGLNETVEYMSVRFKFANLIHYALLHSTQVARLTSKMVHRKNDRIDLHLYNSNELVKSITSVHFDKKQRLYDALNIIYYVTKT